MYAGADIIALTSDNEGTPVALIEALAAGKCVVATDVGGVRDVLDDGRLGELVPARDVTGFCQAVEKLMDDSARRAQLSADGPGSARNRFGLQQMLAETESLYRELLQSALLRRDDLEVPAGVGRWVN